MAEHHQAADTSEPSERWEYMTTRQVSDKMLNVYGYQGWELVAIEMGFAFFKRPLVAAQSDGNSDP